MEQEEAEGLSISPLLSLHDCKIVNTDYLLTLFSLEPGFCVESESRYWALSANSGKEGHEENQRSELLCFVLKWVGISCLFRRD